MIKPTSSQRKLTQKQITFAEKVADGLNLSAAYRAAYAAENCKSATVNRAAKELADNPRVAAEIARLRGGAAAFVKKPRSKEEAILEVWRAREAAKQAGNAGAAVRALRLLCKLQGLLPRRRKARPTAEALLEPADVSVVQALLDELQTKRALKAAG